MKILINTCLDKNKISFNLCIPILFFNGNENAMDFIDSKNYLYDIDKIDFNYLEKEILNDISKVMDKNDIEQIDFTYFINENCNSIDNIIKFLSKGKNIPITIISDNYREIINYFGNKKYPNLKISFKNSDNAISYKEFYDMFKKLNELIEFVRYYKLSNLEKCLLIYDIVKSNKYVHESENEDYSISRDLNKIISSGKIVCSGYSNLISFLLTNLGIKNGNIILKYESKKNLHERNYIYLKDE